MKTDLSKYNNSWYKPGGNSLLRLLWYACNHLIFNHAFLPFSSLKVFILRIFGAQIGKGLVIKPSVNIKYPWRLSIGDNSWIGEGVWIDNLADVTIGNNCCISQGAMLLTGNHDYTSPNFDLKTGAIILEDGVWIGAKALVAAGVTCETHAVLSAASIAIDTLESYTIYQGNPAVKKRSRIIK